MNIPVFHDDQHGTAIISSAALINALELVGKKIEDIRIVVNGAGAAANSCAKLAIALGVKPNNMIMCDTKGVIYKGRVEGMNPYKELFAADTHFRTLEEAADGADVLFGLSVKGAFTTEMVASMAPNPIIFAMANPDPEITPEDAHAVRERRHHRHRPLRLSQPGQQRPRLPLHLPRRPRLSAPAASTKR